MTTARTAAVVTVSDSSSRGERADLSGPATAELLRQHGFEITHQEIVPDEQPVIEAALRADGRAGAVDRHYRRNGHCRARCHPGSDARRLLQAHRWHSRKNARPADWRVPLSRF